ncbi:hypothetical protein QBC98_007770 [Kitasatospora acidiphila]
MPTPSPSTTAWYRERLRTNLWLVPAVEALLFAVLFAVTVGLDRLAYDGRLNYAAWVLNGTADGARQILSTMAAALITVVGLVFSITIVALTLALHPVRAADAAHVHPGPGHPADPGHLRGDLLLHGAGTGGHQSGAARRLRAAPVGDRVTGADPGGPGGAHLLHPPHRHDDPAAAGDRGDRRRPGRGHRRAERRRPRAGAVHPCPGEGAGLRTGRLRAAAPGGRGGRGDPDAGHRLPAVPQAR